MRISDWSSDVCSSDLAPTCCTSRAVRYLKTSAAASSPSDIINTALRVTPVSGLLSFFIVAYPGAHHHGDSARVFGSHVARAQQRSEERRVGNECVSPSSTWWSPYH